MARSCRQGVSPLLLRAYRTTRYEVAGAAAQVGRRSAGIDAVLARMGTPAGVFITAWNPMSRRMPEGWNRRAQGQLHQRLRRWRTLPATGTWRRWHEAHLLVAADPRPILRLARVFRQLAVVIVTRDRPARLLLLRPFCRGPKTQHRAANDQQVVNNTED